ncbi:hypothetical protein [Streptomyces sp. SID161]|uniref:hypothetical protein n=1 Tax=unclassified Streptomyces TaxID=2593676 RepID=UPI00136A9696|nr:hypothetical protein [Streptomyces sp. SID161]MYW49073.1 hypothetical protein [Streptomyces sp. SID161]
MTVGRTATLLGTAVETALAVPGVAGLEPRLSRRLAAAAAPARADRAPDGPSEAGVRADRSPDGSGWHIEVRCVLSEGRRALDVARDVHDRVGAAVVRHLTAFDTVERVTVEVTVTGVTPRRDAA